MAPSLEMSDLPRLVPIALVTLPTYIAALAMLTALRRLSPMHPQSDGGQNLQAVPCLPFRPQKEHEYVHEHHGDVVRIGMSRLPYASISLTLGTQVPTSSLCGMLQSFRLRSKHQARPQDPVRLSLF